jgi:hypothetical protein
MTLLFAVMSQEDAVAHVICGHTMKVYRGRGSDSSASRLHHFNPKQVFAVPSAQCTSRQRCMNAVAKKNCWLSLFNCAHGSVRTDSDETVSSRTEHFSCACGLSVLS